MRFTVVAAVSFLFVDLFDAIECFTAPPIDCHCDPKSFVAGGEDLALGPGAETLRSNAEASRYCPTT